MKNLTNSKHLPWILFGSLSSSKYLSKANYVKKFGV